MCASRRARPFLETPTDSGALVVAMVMAASVDEFFGAYVARLCRRRELHPSSPGAPLILGRRPQAGVDQVLIANGRLCVQKVVIGDENAINSSMPGREAAAWTIGAMPRTSGLFDRYLTAASRAPVTEANCRTAVSSS